MAFTVYFIFIFHIFVFYIMTSLIFYLKSTYPVGPVDLCFTSFDLKTCESTYINIRGTLS